jgi:hypothetical protein
MNLLPRPCPDSAVILSAFPPGLRTWSKTYYVGEMDCSFAIVPVPAVTFAVLDTTVENSL